jgi:ABC-type bacteriocin/lantibiotic exporter with double-glycine peptidase domain
MNGNKPQIHLLPVKPVVQVNSYECGVACVGTILKTIGFKYDRERVKKALKTNPKWGTDQIMIKKYLKSSGVAYQAWGAKKYYETMQSGHYSVVCGYEKDYLWLADPFVKKTSLRYQKGLRKIKNEVFLERWKDVDSKDRVYSRWFLAV